MYRISTHINEQLDNYLDEVAKNTDYKTKAEVNRRAIAIIKQIYDAQKRGAKITIKEINGNESTLRI